MSDANPSLRTCLYKQTATYYFIDALSLIYRRGPPKWPKLLDVDPGCDFMGAVSQLLAKHNVEVRGGRVDIHRDQAIVERFNRTLAERLFGHQYVKEMSLPSNKQSTVG